jgi:hypothetical protein
MKHSHINSSILAERKKRRRKKEREGGKVKEPVAADPRVPSSPRLVSSNGAEGWGESKTPLEVRKRKEEWQTTTTTTTTTTNLGNEWS